MRDNDPIQGFGLECPYGSTFYVCKYDPNRFIGCCGVNPCGARKGLCPDQHLCAASFDKAYEEYIPSQACISDNIDVAWHACSWSTSSFMGCCAVDPCFDGCPSRQLRAAKLSDNSKNAQVFLGDDYRYPTDPIPTPSPSPSPAVTTSVNSATAITTAAISSFLTSYVPDINSEAYTSTVESAAPTSDSHDHSNNDICLSKGGLAGIVVVVVLLVIAAIWKVWKHKSHQNKGKDDDEKSNTSNRGSALVQQGVRSNATQTPDQNRRRVQLTSQVDTSPHIKMHHQCIPIVVQKEPEVAQRNRYLQPPSPARPSRSPSPKNDDKLPVFQDPSGLPSGTRDRNLCQSFSFELEGSPVRDSCIVAAPSLSRNPFDNTNDTGTPHDSFARILGEVGVTNGHTSNRNSDTSKIGPDSNGGVRL